MTIPCQHCGQQAEYRDPETRVPWCAPCWQTHVATSNGQHTGDDRPHPADRAEREPDASSGPAAGDVANAERFLAEHGDRFRYFAATRRWLTYDAGVWREDPDRVQARAAGEQVVRDLLREAADEPDPDRAKALSKAAQRSMTAGRLAAMLDVAEPHIAVAVDDLDADPWMLNVTNGIVDLRTGELLNHDPARLLTRQTTAAYLPDLEPKRWLRFLGEILPDAEVRAFVQRLVGAALVGVQRDHVLPILYGTGANGKSTTIGAITRALGSYALTVPTALMVGRGSDRDGPSPELVKLRGVRLAIADEPEAGARLREAHIKALTGGDRITARALYSDPIEFDPTHTLALVTNHRPQVQGTDTGLWRRLLLVPFTVTVPDADQDPDLPVRLAAEADGILAWAVAGALAWQQRGLDPPGAVKAATADYRAEQDHIAAFIEDVCHIGERMRAPAGPLYKAYHAWCTANGHEPLTATTFGSDLTDRGYGKVKSAGRIHRLGIALAAHERDSQGQSGGKSYVRAHGESSAQPSLTVPAPDDEPRR